MSDRQLRDEAMTLYLAGHETTALTSTIAGPLSIDGLIRRKFAAIARPRHEPQPEHSR